MSSIRAAIDPVNLSVDLWLALIDHVACGDLLGLHNPRGFYQLWLGQDAGVTKRPERLDPCLEGIIVSVPAEFSSLRDRTYGWPRLSD